MPNGVDLYPDVTVKWHRGHPPELLVFQDQKEIQRIDLAPYDYAQLHDLVASKFEKNTGKDGALSKRRVNDMAAINPTKDSTATEISGVELYATMPKVIGALALLGIGATGIRRLFHKRGSSQQKPPLKDDWVAAGLHPA